MNRPVPVAPTLDLIAAASADLTPTQRRIAAAALADPTLLAFGTVSDLAGQVGTSRPSIVRFATRLGFEGYSDLQQRVRDDLSRRLSRPSERIRRDRGSKVSAKAAIMDAISTVFGAVDGERITALVTPIVQARKVWILSGETSQAGARALQSGLSMVRSSVHTLEEHSFGTELSDAAPGDTAIVIDFPRYRKQVTLAAEVLAEAGVTVVAITDSPLSPLVELADTWSQIMVPAVGPFDSSVPIVAMCELVVAEVAGELKEEATDRIDRIEALWDQTETFV